MQNDYLSKSKPPRSVGVHGCLWSHSPVQNCSLVYYLPCHVATAGWAKGGNVCPEKDNQIPSPWNIKAWLKSDRSWNILYLYLWKKVLLYLGPLSSRGNTQLSVLPLMLGTIAVYFYEIPFLLLDWDTQSLLLATKGTSTDSSVVSTDFTITHRGIKMSSSLSPYMWS